MTDIRKLAFVGLMSLGLATVGSAGCSSSGSSGTGGSTGTGGTGAGTGGSHTGGSTGTGGAGTGTGGAAGAAAALGCPASDAPASADIADFAGGDASIQIIHGDNDPFTYGDTPKPTFTIASSGLNITDTIQVSATPHYQGVGIYFNGNAAGTDCIDATTYTGVQFDISGSLVGTGCALVFSINDSEHGDSSVLKVAGDPTMGQNDPKAAGPKGSYSPQLPIASSSLTSTATTIKVPFTGTGAPAGGSPATPIDPTKIEGVQWQVATPVAADGGATECDWNITVANVKFY